MRRLLVSELVALLAFSGVSGAPSVEALEPMAIGAPTTAGAELWVRRYDSPGNFLDVAWALDVSPDGSTVFVTGQSNGRNDNGDYATVAVDALTGSMLWVKRYDGEGAPFDYDVAVDLGVSPDGRKVFVTGVSYGKVRQSVDFATVAYEASTGVTLWARRYDERGGHEHGRALGVSPDGARVFVTGVSEGGSIDADYATIAYDASTGAKLWTAHYNGPQNDLASGLAVSPDGTKVFVTGQGATVAYDASTGVTLWVRPYDRGENSGYYATALGVSPDGASLFVTGGSYGGSTGADYATIAYDASTGARLWMKGYNGRGNGGDGAEALGVSPDGATVFVTGQSYWGPANGYDYATVAHDASTGTRLWARRYNGPWSGGDSPTALGVSPDGATVFVTGQSYGGPATGLDYATVAYDASTGTRLWARRYNGPWSRYDWASALAVSPVRPSPAGGHIVFVTGGSDGRRDLDYATIAYSTV